MPKEKKQALCVAALRHNEYYEMQEIFDNLYAKSKDNKIFTNLIDIIFSKENILLAYRNLKTNSGSKTPGTDRLTIQDIEKLSPEEVIQKVRNITIRNKGYNPRRVRRKDISKPNGKTRPLGIPCIWDRLIQQCIKQVLEPICEAKFSEHSYGFRPDRSVENAIAEYHRLLSFSHLYYVIEFDIKEFFDNVNHSKLIKQMWTMGIQDKQLLYIVKQILKTPIEKPDGTIINPTKGTPQGGIISPLLANITLNELDHWVENNWENNPIAIRHIRDRGEKGIDKGVGYTMMRNTKLKEMYIIRYADDFRIFCRTKEDAERTKIAIIKWLNKRLKLEISKEKTRIVDIRKQYSEFLGFRIKAQKKGKKYTTKSRMSEMALKRETDKLIEQIKRIARPRQEFGEIGEIRIYNAMVIGIQNYYCIATHISMDASIMEYLIMKIMKSRLSHCKGTKNRLKRNGRELTNYEKQKYGISKMLRYLAGTKEPIYPIGYVKFKKPLNKNKNTNRYTKTGRAKIHENLKLNMTLLTQLMKTPVYEKSIELTDNKLALFSAQYGKCAITGKTFICCEEIHCHHKIPRAKGGTDKYKNLILIIEEVHKLIHSTDKETISKYLTLLNLDKKQLQKVNKLRQLAKLEEIKI